MLTKLAFKNFGKSVQDYAVYFFTLVLGVSIFYMFNSIYAQQEIMTATQTTNASMESLTKILSYISIFVAVILGFLIVYANNFFIKRRKKELGIYLTLGMTRGKISTILVLETALMAIIALAIGLILGILGSQFMSVFTAKIFEADMTAFKFVFSPDAAVKSILYFSIIFLVVIGFNTYSIKKVNLIDLLNGGRKNEVLKVEKLWISILLFILSVVCIISAYVIILKNGLIDLNIYFSMSIILGSIGTLLFFFSIAGILTKLTQSSKRIYFNNLNMFVLRQINSKINTNFVSISIVSIVLLLVIGIFSSGYSLQNVLSEDLKEGVPFDFSLYNYSSDGNETSPIYEELPNYITAFEGIEDYQEIATYEIPRSEMTFKDFPIDFGVDSFDVKNNAVQFITLSDYNNIRELLNMEPLELPEDRYAILSTHDELNPIANQLVSDNTKLSVHDYELLPMSRIEKTNIHNGLYQILFIVNESVSRDIPVVERILNFQISDTEQEYEFNKMLKEFQIKSSSDAFAFYQSRIEISESSITTKAIVSFLAIYLGIVFMITCAAILAIQQLSEAADNKKRYELLAKLGTDKKMINKALFTQILCYFLLPLMLATVHSVVGLKAANDVIKMFGKVDVTSSIVATSVFILVVYGLYFIITYFGSKNIIHKG